jgi:regulation of enolase protein 1 (concanavalin A-like superfamily)
MTHRIVVSILIAVSLVVCNEIAAAEIAGWGTAVNPDSQCEIKTGAGSKTVTIRLPDTKHDLWAGQTDETTRFNAPRVLQEVEGNFVATVRVTANWTTGIEQGGYNGAGLVIWESGKQYLRLERNRCVKVTNPGTAPYAFSYTTPLYDQNGRRVFYNSTRQEFFKGNTTWLRLNRHDARIACYFSHDGQTWVGMGVVTSEFPERVQVGIHAVNTGGPFAVLFDQFSIVRR